MGNGEQIEGGMNSDGRPPLPPAGVPGEHAASAAGEPTLPPDRSQPETPGNTSGEPDELAQLEAAFAEPSAIRSAEDQVIDLEREVYAHSTILIREVGEMALALANEGRDLRAEVDPEIAELIKALKADFEASIVEMLQTDPEFRKMLEITREQEFQIADGFVIWVGQRVVEIIARGTEKARLEALADPRMLTQVRRNQADLRNAKAVDAMAPGTLRMTLAIDPKDALRQDPAFWRELGYREELAFLQCYYKVDEETLVTFAYSVDYSDLAKWRETWAEAGGHISENASTDDWLDFAIVRECVSVDQARMAVHNLRASYYQQHGLPAPLRSVEEFKAANQHAIDDVFYHLYLPYAMAHAQSSMDDTMRALSAQLFQKSDFFNAEAKATVQRLMTARELDDDGARFLENIIRYGLVEHLRTGLAAFGRGQKSGFVAGFAPQFGAPMHLNIIHNLTEGVARGAEVNREYGGCSARFSVGRDGPQTTGGDKNSVDRAEQSSQDVFGGLDSIADEPEGESAGVCVVDTTGCYCCGLNVDGTPRSARLTVQAKIDARGTIHCMRSGCGAWMSKGGKPKFEGYIAALGRERAASERRTTGEASATSAPEAQAAAVGQSASEPMPSAESQGSEVHEPAAESAPIETHEPVLESAPAPPDETAQTEEDIVATHLAAVAVAVEMPGGRANAPLVAGQARLPRSRFAATA